MAERTTRQTFRVAAAWLALAMGIGGQPAAAQAVSGTSAVQRTSVASQSSGGGASTTAFSLGDGLPTLGDGLPTLGGGVGSTSQSIADAIGGPGDWTSPDRLSSTLQVMLMLTVISLAPAVLLMTTSFVRIVVVLGLLRQALGTQQLPPSQVITSIALFVTLLLMAPVWQETYEAGIKPYTDGQIGLEDAFARGTEPLRRFMADQIQRTDNDDDVYLFLSYLPEEQAAMDEADARGDDAFAYAYYSPEEGERLVPLQALLPAFMLSELKTAFLIGFQIYLPFVILDIVVASVTISMGMLMLPPVLISLPFKLLLFVLLDGWRLVIEMLLESFVVFV
ncbi:MAG: flagellar type III secretion system pore protein FliP [Planctomycetota bacterium]